jgi:hypothetical protein
MRYLYVLKLRFAVKYVRILRVAQNILWKIYVLGKN